MSKQYINLSLLVVCLVLLPGCMGWFQGDSSDKKKNCKKVADNSGTGLPLSGYKKGQPKFFDSAVEAFVLEEDDEDQELQLHYTDTRLQDQGTKKIKSAKNTQLAWNNENVEVHDFEPVHFNFDRWDIKDNQEAVLAYNVEKAKEEVEKGANIRVEGHSDNKFLNGRYNVAVSQKRAETVTQKLAEAGVSREHLKPIGYGADKPAVQSSGKDERNRRVELHLLPKQA